MAGWLGGGTKWRLAKRGTEGAWQFQLVQFQLVQCATAHSKRVRAAHLQRSVRDTADAGVVKDVESHKDDLQGETGAGTARLALAGVVWH